MAVQLGDVASWVTGLATAGAFIFAGVQLFLIRRQDRKDREVEISGVSVSWRAPRPETGKLKDETTRDWWRFSFLAQNPGRLPIRNIKVRVEFPVTFQRIRYNDFIEKPTNVLDSERTGPARGLVSPVGT